MPAGSASPGGLWRHVTAADAGPGVERALEGKALDTAGIAAARAAALEGVQPVTDAIASDWYRREVLPVHLARLLAERG